MLHVVNKGPDNTKPINSARASIVVYYFLNMLIFEKTITIFCQLNHPLYFRLYNKNARIPAVELIKPSEKYKESFLTAAEELRNDKTRKYETEAQVTKETFEIYLKTLDDYSKGVNLPKDYVPSSEFWLVDHGDYIGRVSIRHRLNETLEKFGGHIGYTIRPSKRGKGYGNKILELGLEKAKEIGLENVLLTCDVSNTPSVKIIEKNGGKFKDKLEQPDGKPEKLRYWIRIE